MDHVWSMWQLIQIINLTGSRITQETNPRACLQMDFPILLIKIGRAILNIGGIIPWAAVLSYIKRRQGVEHQPLSLSLCFLTVAVMEPAACQDPADMVSLPWWTAVLLPSVAFVRCLDSVIRKTASTVNMTRSMLFVGMSEEASILDLLYNP